MAKPMTETEIRALFVKQREIDIGTYLPDWEAAYIHSRGKNGRTIKDLWQGLPQYRSRKQRYAQILNILLSFQSF